LPLSRELIGNYADALYAAARSAGVQEQVRTESERLLEFARGNADVLRRLSFAFKSARVGRSRKKELLSAFCDGLGLGEITSRWVVLTARYGRFALLPYFVEEFVDVFRRSEGLLLATVETALPLTETQKAGMKKALEKALSASVDLEIQENADLIAGVRATVEGRTWDMSIKGALRRLAYRPT
jgi:F-type H+-transporting ATPase subunit delta